MFENKEYIDLLLDIAERELMTKADLAKAMAIGYSTLMVVLAGKPIGMKVKKKIRDFINKYNKGSK